jgi:hypothetical protein
VFSSLQVLFKFIVTQIKITPNTGLRIITLERIQQVKWAISSLVFISKITYILLLHNVDQVKRNQSIELHFSRTINTLWLVSLKRIAYTFFVQQNVWVSGVVFEGYFL